jgi:hypothetical protein
MFSHATISTDVLACAAAFYDAVLAPLGIKRAPSRLQTCASWHRGPA